LRGRAIDQDATGLQAIESLSVLRDPDVHALIVGFGSCLEADPSRTHRIDSLENVVGAECDMLNPFASIVLQKFLDLRLVILAFVQRNALEKSPVAFPSMSK
jgi:hypothetical protein